MPTTAYLHIGDRFHGWEMIGLLNEKCIPYAIFRKGDLEKIFSLEPTRSWLSIMFALKAA